MLYAGRPYARLYTTSRVAENATLRRGWEECLQSLEESAGGASPQGKGCSLLLAGLGCYFVGGIGLSTRAVPTGESGAGKLPRVSCSIEFEIAEALWLRPSERSEPPNPLLMDVACDARGLYGIIGSAGLAHVRPGVLDKLQRASRLSHRPRQAARQFVSKHGRALRFALPCRYAAFIHRCLNARACGRANATHHEP